MSLPCFFLQGCSFSDAVYLTEGELFAFETLRKTERELTHEWSVVQDTACQASVEREVVRGGGRGQRIEETFANSPCSHNLQMP